MRVLFASLLLLALSSCASVTGPQHFSGVYVWGFETEAFYSYAGGDPYWVSADPDALAALQSALPQPLDPQAGARVVADVEGVLSPPGLYGHLGAYTRELHITRVLSARLQLSSPAGS